MIGYRSFQKHVKNSPAFSDREHHASCAFCPSPIATAITVATKPALPRLLLLLQRLAPVNCASCQSRTCQSCVLSITHPALSLIATTVTAATSPSTTTAAVPLPLLQLPLLPLPLLPLISTCQSRLLSIVRTSRRSRILCLLRSPLPLLPPLNLHYCSHYYRVRYYHCND